MRHSYLFIYFSLFFLPLPSLSSFCAFPAHQCVVRAKKPPVKQRHSSPSVQSHSNRKRRERGREVEREEERKRNIHTVSTAPLYDVSKHSFFFVSLLCPSPLCQCEEPTLCLLCIDCSSALQFGFMFCFIVAERAKLCWFLSEDGEEQRAGFKVTT